MAQVRLLLLPGVGGNFSRLGWDRRWHGAIAAALLRHAERLGGELEVESASVDFDPLFAQHPMNAHAVFGGVMELLGSALLTGILGGERGLGDLRALPERVRWTAGMVVQWAGQEALRAETRSLLAARAREYQPDVIVAHSLGSLIAYDTLRREDAQAFASVRWLVTFGSQIGHPGVRRVLGGRIAPLDADGRLAWYQLYNPNDDVLVVPLAVPSPTYQQITCHFERPGLGDHDAVAPPDAPTEYGYLDHPEAAATVWAAVATRTLDAGKSPTPSPVPTCVERRADRRALLIGVNEYANPQWRLEGCVNDVFEVSATLQTLGMSPDEIRVVLNERATAAGIRARLDWLLGDVRDGDLRLLYFSGHGAQYPGYNAASEPDHWVECLVPHDFDWTPQRAISDDELWQRYSQLPYDARFIMMLDCCHAGGMTRGTGVPIRGLDPPDDIRHRALRWDADTQLWVARAMTGVTGELAATPAFTGSNGVTHRLGRAIPLREGTAAAYDTLRHAYAHHGPYLPIVLEACQEAQTAVEYKHGFINYGAFTYCLTHLLREAKPLTFRQLRDELEQRLHLLGIQTQTPTFTAPQEILDQVVPFHFTPVLTG